MRPIDADALLKNYDLYKLTGELFYKIADMIDNAPTVDPVWDEIPVCSTEVIDGIVYINLKADAMEVEHETD